MSLCKAFPIILCLAYKWQLFSLTFGFCTASWCSSFSSKLVCSKIKVNFNQNHRPELWNFIVIDWISFSTRSCSRTPYGESPSITRREWQREIDQIISCQTLLLCTEEIYLRCNKTYYILWSHEWDKFPVEWLTLRAPRVLVPTPSTKGGGSKRTPPVSQEREMLQTWNLWRG